MKKLQIQGVRFCLGVENIKGIIDASDGFVKFYSPERKIMANLPFGVTADAFGQEVVATMYAGTNRIVTKRTRDHIPLDKLRPGDIDLLNNIDILYDKLEEQKIENIPKVTKEYMSVISCALGIVISYLCREILPKIWIGFLCASVAILVWSVIMASSLTRVLNSNVIYDDYGHWIDLETGETNLAGGYTIPIEGKEDFM